MGTLARITQQKNVFRCLSLAAPCLRIPQLPELLLRDDQRKRTQKKWETQELGSNYRKKVGKREIVRAIENSNAAKRAFSDN